MTIFSFRLAPEPAHPFVQDLCSCSDLDPFLPASVAAKLLHAEAIAYRLSPRHGYDGAAVHMNDTTTGQAPASACAPYSPATRGM